MNKSDSRINKSIKNSSMALFEQIICSLMSFVGRTVFIYTLGKTYLGFNGLFGDIFSLLSLAEMGVSTAIIYLMYEPAAYHEYEKIAALLNIYKKIYMVIAIVITITGLLFLPFLDFFISDIPKMPELPVMYLLFLFSTVISYLFVYKKSILIIDQRDYIASLIYVIAVILQNILQIIFLYITHDFTVYLIIQIMCTIGNNVAVSVYVDRHYTYLKQYKNAKIDKETKESIVKNVKAMFLSRVSSAIVTSTDNILISKYVSTVTLGIYSNYTLFTNLLRKLLTKIFGALTGSVGNLIVLESKEKVYRTFKQIWFVNFWLVAFSGVSLFVLLNPFIEVWLGTSYLLDKKVLFIICFNLYMRLIRNTFLILIDTYGLFVEIKPKCIAETIINVVASLIFLIPLHMGIYGVLLGTFVSNILTNFWYEPYLLYVKKFEVGMGNYLRDFTKYLAITFFSGAMAFYICHEAAVLPGWPGFLLKTVLCVIITNSILFLFFHNTMEFQYFMAVFKNKFLQKIKR